jgi:hypothetical protein
VVEGARCTYCGAWLGAGCQERRYGVSISAPTHAARWYDYWNATHDRADQIAVYPAKWLASA